MEAGDLWGCFKRCSVCRGKIASTDGHLKCLLCLGEDHIVNTCEICKKFSRKNRAARLQQALVEQALKPMASPEKTGNQTPSASTSTVHSGSSQPVSKTALPSQVSSPVSTKSVVSAAVAGSKTKKPHRDKGKKDAGAKEKVSGSGIVPPVITTSHEPIHTLPPPAEVPPDELLQVSPVKQRRPKDPRRDRRKDMVEDDLEEPYTLQALRRMA